MPVPDPVEAGTGAKGHRVARGMWVLTAVAVLNVAGFSISIPFLSLYLFQSRGLSMAQVGAVIMVSGLCSAVAQVFSGVLADRFGRRPMLLSSVFAGTLLQFVMAGLIGADAPVAYIVVAYTGVRAALMMGRPAFSAMVADLSPRERLAEGYGLLRIGQNVGWAAGPAVGGYLTLSLSYAWLFVFAGLMGVVTLGVVVLFLRESLGSGGNNEVNVRSLFSGELSGSFLGFMALGMLVFLVMGQMVSTLSVYTVDRAGFSNGQYGTLLTLNGVLVALLQYPVTRVLERTGRATVLVAGSLLYGAGYLVLAWVGGFPLAAVSMTIVTLGEIVLAPTTLAVVGELSPHGWRGRYMGLYGLSETVGMSLGPMVGGLLLDAFPTQPLSIWGTIALLGVAAAAGFGLWSALTAR
ncbi:MAG: MFS transporter, partial [Chloroflexota bacterium]